MSLASGFMNNLSYMAGKDLQTVKLREEFRKPSDSEQQSQFLRIVLQNYFWHNIPYFSYVAISNKQFASNSRDNRFKKPVLFLDRFGRLVTTL
jgi:hypothetical protein